MDVNSILAEYLPRANSLGASQPMAGLSWTQVLASIQSETTNYGTLSFTHCLSRGLGSKTCAPRGLNLMGTLFYWAIGETGGKTCSSVLLYLLFSLSYFKGYNHITVKGKLDSKI